MLTVAHLSAGYGKTQVLWDVNITMAEGERLALVGANGAGKTTFIRCLSGLVPAREGEISWSERPITAEPPHRRVALGLVHVPEGRRLFAGMTTAENLRMGAYHLRLSRGEEDRRMQKVLDLFPELLPKFRQLAGTMSGGEQQMCAIGRALMAAPRILMVDEMSLGLAPVVVERLVAALLHINRQDRVALLIVEQDVSLALELCDRAYVLETGQIRLSGTAAELRANDEVRAAYLGL